LAIKVILDQGIEIVALNFKSPFCLCEKSQGCGSSIKKMAGQLGVELKNIYLGQEYLEMIENPKYGYGKNLNPCIDCRIFKFKQAKKIMEEIGAAFTISGEVLGQRPMSQHRRALQIIETESGLEGLILRPLSAKLFPPTLPEEKGWINRDSLLDIQGRTRKPQINLASCLGIKDYPCPAGGCLLTETNFSRRIKDLFKSGKNTFNNAQLLRLGRHFRITPEFKLIVGRNENENTRILNLAQEKDLIFEPDDLPGPTALGRGSCSKETELLASKIIARYTSRDNEVKVRVKTCPPNGEKSFLVEEIDEKELERFRI
jgi:tRNA U34 2-thiouridine synthase MnmA/TrmU